MNLKCLICSDLFVPSSEIYATVCGHMFHYNCLLQWIERSPTCPQCRSKSTEKSIHRIYISVEENAETTDFGTLQNKLDNLQFQMNLKDKDIKNATEKYQSAKAQNGGLREEIRDQENRIRVLESAMHALKEQVGYFKSKSKDNNKLEEEIVKLKEKLRDMENVQTVITGSREQVNDMLRHNRDPQSLTILVSTLKKELIDSDRRRKQVQSILKDVQNQSHNYKKEAGLLSKENFKLQQEVEAHKHCETERQYLKKKIGELKEMHSQNQNESQDVTNTSIRRIIAESPAPFSKQLHQLKASPSVSSNTSPSVPETVQSIKDSESPYLRVQSSTVGLSGLMNYNVKYQPKSSSTKTTQFSMFKKQQMGADVAKKSHPVQTSYNGLGGHSKDEEFPSPKPAVAGMKRHISSSTVTSAKFRKLAPAPQKQLKDFFQDTNYD